MTFERTYDYPLIQIILTHPRTYGLMTNDGAPPLTRFEVRKGDYTAILCHHEDGLLAGLFLIVPGASPRTAEIHFCFLPGAAWRMGEAGREFVEWVWREMAFSTLIGQCPSYNPLALRTAKAAGFRETGREQRQETKNGRPFDLIVTRIERPREFA